MPSEARPSATEAQDSDPAAPPVSRRRVDPYARAPRLPEGEVIDARDIVRGVWLELEVGPGRGTFLFERAAAAPEAGLIALEIRRKWATLVDDRLKARGLGDRARVFAEDAKLALPRLGPDGAFARAFLHFPDPWWKKRHQKRLVMGDEFIAQIVRLLVPGGELFVQTDVEERAEQYEQHLRACEALEPCGDLPESARLAENPYGARTNREHRAIDDGLPVYRLRFRKRRG
jgi:tRNA (guanine-N7-)-methyltransferase